LLPFLAPLADLGAGHQFNCRRVYTLLMPGFLQIVWYYLVFTLVDVAGAAIASHLKKKITANCGGCCRNALYTGN
jgi:hypothetical protein